MLKRFLRFLGFIPKEIPETKETELEPEPPKGAYLVAPAGSQVYLFYPHGKIILRQRVIVPNNVLFACIAISRNNAKNKFHKFAQNSLNNPKPFNQ